MMCIGHSLFIEFGNTANALYVYTTFHSMQMTGTYPTVGR